MPLDLTTISGTIYDVLGQPKAGIEVYIVSAIKSGLSIYDEQTLADTSDASGVVSFTVPRASTVWLQGNFYVGATDFTVSTGISLVIPDSATATLESLGAAYSVPVQGVTLQIDGASQANLIGTFNFRSQDFTIDVSDPGVADFSLAAALIVTTEQVQDALTTFFPDSGPYDWTYDDLNNKVGLVIASFVGDSGAGGVTGLVPAPASGDAAANKFLKADGLWTAVVAPAWGAITGTLGNQTDLQSALDLKAPLISPSFTTPSLGVADATSLNVALLNPTGNIIEQRNGTTVQTFNVYKTYTNASNYERLTLGWNGSTRYQIGVDYDGTGAARDIALTGLNIQFGISGFASTVWSINSTGHFLAAADNTYDIGASGATRPRTGYFGTSIVVPAAIISGQQTIGVGGTSTGLTDLLINPLVKASGNLIDAQVNSASKFSVDNAGSVVSQGGATITLDLGVGAARQIYFTGRSVLASPSDGVITLSNYAATDFSRLQFGGTTSSFPALKRSATILQGRLADDSDFCPVQGRLRVHANAAAETPTATHTLRVFDAAGTEYKVLCVPA